MKKKKKFWLLFRPFNVEMFYIFKLVKEKRHTTLFRTINITKQSLIKVFFEVQSSKRGNNMSSKFIFI